MNLQRITDFVGMEEQPAASPDGKTAAFIAPVDGRRQVWVRLLAGGAPLQITRDDVDHEHPRWAPDSSSLIYFSSAAREGDPGMLWEISALGGTPRRIAASQGPGDLSHDGRRIATFRTQGSRTALAIVERDGSKSERAIALPALSEFSSPRWSPDDQSIAFVGAIEIAFNRALYVMDVAGGEPKQIANAQNIQGVALDSRRLGARLLIVGGSTMTYPPVFNLRTVSIVQCQSGKQFIVVIDEAQNLEGPVLEVVRMLSNFETSRDKLMQIILAGQPQLADKLGSADLVQLRQRISLFGHLKPFDATETNLYIDHRLSVAGYDFRAPLFTRQARAIIAKGSEGIPRNISNICFNALSLGCALKQKTIDRDVILEVLGDLDVTSLAVKPSVVTKTEEHQKYTPARTVSKAKGQSVLRTWLPRFAVASAFFAALSWPVMNTVRHTPQTRTARVPVTAEAAAVGLVTEQTSGAPRKGLDSESSPTPSSVVSATAQASHEVVQRQGGDSPNSSKQQFSATRIIRVKPYETLYRICADNFGRCNTELMTRIFELNPSLVNPDSLKPGQELRLPATTPGSEIGGGQRDQSSNAPGTKAGRP